MKFLGVIDIYVILQCH